MNHSHTIQFSTQPLERAFRDWIRANNIRIHGFLSRKKEGVVALVSDAQCDTPARKWIARISSYSHNHKTYQFGKIWYDKGCIHLPEMSEPKYHKYHSKYFVIEQYEFIGTPPDDSQVDENGEFPASCFTDLFQFVRDHGAHKSMKYLYTALCGLAVLHDQDWFHFDFSLENIACGDNDRGVLIDYEASSFIMHDFVEQREVMKSYKITYAAPEMEKGDALVHPAGIDVWAFGVALFLTITQQYPFKVRGPRGKIDRHILFEYVREHGFMAYLAEYKPETVDKIREYPHLEDLLEEIFIVYPVRFSPGYHRDIFLCSVDGRERLSAAEIRDHVFWGPYLQEKEERIACASKPMLVSDIVSADADCQISPEDVQRTGSWWGHH